MNETTILFLCPHAAAKSVLAMNYCKRLASEAGLAVKVWNAGTEPEPTINRAVKRFLEDEGFELDGFVPSLLTNADLEAAQIVVSIGCIGPERVPKGTRFLDWSDVPMLSDDFVMARDQIYKHVVDLVNELAPN